MFYNDHKRLPVSGVVPDMTSTTEYFLELQKIYVKKAEEDKALMLDYLK